VAFAGALLATSAYGSRARAQQQPVQGFRVERFYPSAPGGGWFVMDDLDLYGGGFGGVAGVTMAYSRNAMRVTDGTQHLAVVSDSFFTDFGFAITLGPMRLYLNLDVPLLMAGQSGTVGGYAFSAPSLDPGPNPDSMSDARIGFDSLLAGAAAGPFRLGTSAQIFVPSGNRAEYESDETSRAMFRVLVAGDAGLLTYAGQLGVHFRSVDDAPAPVSPRGSELLFGAAAGAKVPVGASGGTALVVGPEVYGESAFRALLGTSTTGLEALLTGRLEGTARDDGPQLRVRLGAGGGISPHFGAPEWRAVIGIELFSRNGPKPKNPNEKKSPPSSGRGK
jgi:hypothetical protein